MASKLEAIIAAQGALSVVSDITATGQWNTYSSSMYRTANAQIAGAVRRALATAGLTVEALDADLAKVKATNANYVPLATIYGFVNDACVKLGVSQHAEAFKAFLRLESPIKGDSIKVNAVNGSSMGLMQMQKGAWEASSKLLTARGIIHEAEYLKGVFDPAMNVLMGVAYGVLNSRYLPSVTPENLYLAHNQGGGFFTRGIVTSFDGQSKEVRKMIKRSVIARRIKPDFRDSTRYGHKSWDDTVV